MQSELSTDIDEQRRILLGRIEIEQSRVVQYNDILRIQYYIEHVRCVYNNYIILVYNSVMKPGLLSCLLRSTLKNVGFNLS